MIKRPRTVYMFVYNYFQNDSRVLKEALTLSSDGYHVHIIAVWKQGLLKNEKFGRIMIHRLNNIPGYFELIGQDKFDRLKDVIYRRRLTNDGNTGVNFNKMPGVRNENNRDRLRFFVSTIKKVLLLHCFYGEIEKFFSEHGKSADAFHAHDLNTLFIACKMAGKYNAKLIYDSHELYVHRNRPYTPPKWFLSFEEAFEKRYIRKTDAVISVSRSIIDYLQAKYNISKPYLIMNAPNSEMPASVKSPCPAKTLYSFKKVLEIDNDKHVLLYTGSITFGRGLEKVIESMVNLEDFIFVMMGYGAGGFKDYIIDIARNLGVEEKIRFYGPVPSDEVTLYAASADIGIAPIENVCLSYYYCAPNKIFEYIQSDLPVIASNFPDMKHIIEQNEIGLACDTSKPAEISKAVEKIMSDYPVYVNNVRKAKEKYCWEKEAVKLKDIYSNLFGGK